MVTAKVVTRKKPRTTSWAIAGLDSIRSGLSWFFKAAFCALALNTLVATYSHAAEGKKVTLTGEMIDTWCYVSQIMGSSEVVVGTAHHVLSLIHI